MSEKSIEMIKEEVKKMIKADIKMSNEVSPETEHLALSVYSQKEYRNLVYQIRGVLHKYPAKKKESDKKYFGGYHG